MAYRKGHGAGAGVPRIEVLAPDELPSATPALTVRAERDANGRFLPSNTVAKNRRTRPGRAGNLSLDRADPGFRPFLAWGLRYGAHRRAEMAKAHGGEISAGVGALIESASLAMAASRYLHSKASETGDPELFKRASALANDARQNELAGWELAARESESRPQMNAIERLRAQPINLPPYVPTYLKKDETK